MSTDPTDLGGINAAGFARRRDTILAALETFRGIDPCLTVNNIVVFLYVAENEGLSVTELAAAAALNGPTASRSARSLASRGERWALPPYVGLLKLSNEGPAKNARTLRLTRAGQDLRDKLDRHILDAVQICSEPDPLATSPVDALGASIARPPSADRQASH